MFYFNNVGTWTQPSYRRRPVADAGLGVEEQVSAGLLLESGPVRAVVKVPAVVGIGKVGQSRPAAIDDVAVAERYGCKDSKMVVSRNPYLSGRRLSTVDLLVLKRAIWLFSRNPYCSGRRLSTVDLLVLKRARW